MSSTDTYYSPTRPPAFLRQDDPLAAEPARQRLAPKKSLLQIIGLSPKKSAHSVQISTSSRSSSTSLGTHRHVTDSNAEIEDLAPQLVHIDDRELLLNQSDEDYGRDVYRWAILYENQRGVTIFSTPYYSSMSLLPVDPPPFTIPTALPQPAVSLTEYPLPDGTWRWVSREWMIDMRGDAQVQYDGFEYSWSFHSKKWRSTIGFMSAGGLVRRRRWVRLMMRPQKPLEQEARSAPSSSGRISEMLDIRYEQTVTTRPPSVNSVAKEHDEDEADEVWKGDENDWTRCRTILKRLGCDGMKLELWKAWLGDDRNCERRGKLRKRRQWTGNSGSSSPPEVSEDRSAETADDKPYAKEAPRELVRAVIRTHGHEIIDLFIFPESRTQFLEISRHTGFLSDLRTCLPPASQLLDFWSDFERMQGRHDE